MKAIKVQTGLYGADGGFVVTEEVVELTTSGDACRWGLSLQTGKVISFDSCEAAQGYGNDDFGTTLNGRRQKGFIGREVTAQWEYEEEIKAARRRLEDRLRKDGKALAAALAAIE
jgi:hypothetical protein